MNRQRLIPGLLFRFKRLVQCIIISLLRMEEITNESSAPEEEVGAATTTQQKTGGRSWFCCGGSAANDQIELDNSPDAEFHADSLIKLTHGVTAYRIVEPKDLQNRSLDTVPIIVCLHSLQGASYMWADIADLLSDFEQGPQARVLVFDFYGHGRSPWTGVDITLDTLVTQTKELMDVLNLTRLSKPAAFVGYDLGGAVAAGFAAKYPNLCSSLSLISPLGIKYKPIVNEKWLNRKFFGEYLMMQQKNKVHLQQEADFYDKSADSVHRYLIDRQADMVRWQVLHTPGYLGAILSTYRNFPMRSMDELFTAIGRHPRPTLSVWGDRDTVCNYKKCMKVTEESFPKGIIVDIAECGHNVPFEKFEDLVKELLTFHKDAFETMK